MPDVVLLSSDYYALYASNGFLWNMTDAWEHSETKNSGRLISTADNVLSALMVNGEDGTKAMYGLSLYRGNGCCTYVKKAWLDKAGIDASKVKDVQMDFNTYYGYLKQMAQTMGHYVISSPGFIHPEAPNTNYLPEFYQKAQYTFYKDTSGKYVDGFAQQEMKEALQRIQTAVNDGVIDKESVNNSTANARDKFYSTDPSTETGVFTYWAGTWATNLKTNLEANGLDSELVAIPPIEELGAYTERVAPAWCITEACSNPEGVYKYFIESMLDGGDMQFLWTYGVEGVHWSTAAEEVCGVKYEEGQFHMLENREKEGTVYTKNHIDPMLAVAPLENDPKAEAVAEEAKVSAETFQEHSKMAQLVVSTDEMAEYNGDLTTLKNEVIAKVVTQGMSVEDGMA